MNEGQRYDDRVVIVTGSARGIGRAIAESFAREGAKVVVNDLSHQLKNAEKVVKLIEEEGGNAYVIPADVGNRMAVQKMVEKTVNVFDRVDILINNAAIHREGGPLHELREEDFDLMFKTNVKGILFCAQAVAPHMIKRRYGKIVNISSVAGIGTSVAVTSLFHASTKGAVNMLTKRLALELGPYGVNVNAVAPGLIKTEETIGGVEEKTIEKRTMLQRIGKPEDIANVVLFLASDESKYITGQVITVDGGRLDFLTHSQ